MNFQVLSQLEEVELREEKEKLRAENKNADDNEFALDIIRPGKINFYVLSIRHRKWHWNHHTLRRDRNGGERGCLDYHPQGKR